MASPDAAAGIVKKHKPAMTVVRMDTETLDSETLDADTLKVETLKPETRGASVQKAGERSENQRILRHIAASVRALQYPFGGFDLTMTPCHGP
jgi:hypothetical protein